MELEDYQKAGEEKDAKKYAWLRHIVLMASGGLTVLVSLHKDTPSNVVAHVLFSITIGLLGVGILFASIALYGEVHQAALKLKETAQYVIRQRKGESNPLFSFLDMPKRYEVCETICYVSLILAILSLIIYAIAT
jgi:hypothetical protein